MGIKIQVKGKHAMFTRPEFSTERVSYDVITPSAARGIIEAVFWHPGLRYVVDKITVLSPIKTGFIRRNEVGAKADSTKFLKVMCGKSNDPGFIYTGDGKNRQQRSSLLLKDVHYVIDAHFEMTDRAAESDSPGKFISMLTRRLEKGQCFHTPYLGCREYPADVTLFKGEPVCPEELKGEMDLGYMLWDMDYSDPEDIKPMFFRAVMKDGVIRVPGRDSGEVFGWSLSRS